MRIGTINMEINKDLVMTSINNKKAVKFNNVFNNDYTWDNFINFINFAIKQNNPNATNSNVKQTIGFVNFWHRFTMTLDELNNVYFPELKEKNNFLQLFIDKKAIGNFGAVSFTDSEPTTGKHFDPVTVMYWNCIGTVKWTIYYENNEEMFILNPGDVILVPANIMHEVNSLTPRAAISFMFEK